MQTRVMSTTIHEATDSLTGSTDPRMRRTEHFAPRGRKDQEQSRREASGKDSHHPGQAGKCSGEVAFSGQLSAISFGVRHEEFP